MFYGIVYFCCAVFLFSSRKNALFLLAIALFVFPLLPSASNYQGARFRLWLEPFLVLSAVAVAEYAWRMYSNNGHKLRNDMR